MKFRTCMATLPLLLVILQAPVGGQAVETDIIKPFLEESTSVVIRVLPSRVDLPGVMKWLVDAGLMPGETGRQLSEQFSPWIQQYVDAGITEFYAIVSLEDISFTGDPPVFFVIPSSPEVNLESLSRMLGSDPVFGGLAKKMNGQMLHGCILFATRKTALRLEGSSLFPRPDLTQALSSGAASVVGPSALRVALGISPTQRRVLNEMLPNIPGPLGGGPVSLVTDGIDYVAMDISAEDSLVMQAWAQSPDSNSADQVHQWLQRLYQSLLSDPDLGSELKRYESMIKVVFPRLEGDKVVTFLGLEKPGAIKMFHEFFTGARNQALSQQTMTNMKQIVLAILIWSNDHQNQWPDSLDQLEDYLGGESLFRKILTHPVTHEFPGFLYTKPAVERKDMERPQETVILRESMDGKPNESGFMGYADGHIQN